VELANPMIPISRQCELLRFSRWSMYYQSQRDDVYDLMLMNRIDGIGDYILFRFFLKILKESEQYKNYKITICVNVVWKNMNEIPDSEYINSFI